jgi:hypothetical protein
VGGKVLGPKIGFHFHDTPDPQAAFVVMNQAGPEQVESDRDRVARVKRARQRRCAGGNGS